MSEEGERCPVSKQTPSEDIVNASIHFLAFVLSVVGGFYLVIFSIIHGSVFYIVSSSVYSVGVASLYGISSWYHLCRNPSRKRLLKVADYICIYLLIAGTYTPFALVTLGGVLGWSLLSVIWATAAIGILSNICHAIRSNFANTSDSLNVTIYLIMGWLCIVAIVPLIEALSWPGFLWLIAGGLFYSFGTLFFLLEKIPFAHSIWHLFVFAGSTCHYISILMYVIR